MEQRVYCLSYCLKQLACCSFYIKCSICSPCCGTIYSSRRRHWPMARSMKRGNSFSHSVTIACFRWLSWIVDVDKPSVEGHPEQYNRLDSSPGCLAATCEARCSLRDVLTPQVRRCIPGSVWRRAVLLQTSVQDASATLAGCASCFRQ